VVGYTAKLLVPELSALNLGVIENVKEYKASVFDVILLELIEAGSSAVCSEVHKLFIIFRIGKKYLKSRKLLRPFIRKIMKTIMMMMMIQIAVIMEVMILSAA
jgi:hypothetical protein